MSEILLSICIPTFNRAAFLDKCLYSIFSQIDKLYEPIIEVYVSNNASTDNTDAVIQKWICKGFFIKYNKNIENIGADGNIYNCFESAAGKYAWILSDDDFIIPGRLNKIIELLQSYVAGVFFLNSYWFDDEAEVKPPVKEELLDFQLFTDAAIFLNTVNYWVTFISGNIINKQYLAEKDWQNKFTKTNLVQLSWVIPAIFKGIENIYVKSPIVACKKTNTGGYNLIKVFGSNFNNILDQYVSEGILPVNCKKAINNHLLRSFFPGLMQPSFSSLYIDQIKQLFILYGTRPVFYWYCIAFPVLKKMKNEFKKHA